MEMCSDRTLAWITGNQELIPINEMEDPHLNLLRRRIAYSKLLFGKFFSTSKLKPMIEDSTMKTLASHSNPKLVRLIRTLTKDHTIWKLTNNGEDPPTGPLLRAAMNEAARRKIIINHPELS